MTLWKEPKYLLRFLTHFSLIIEAQEFYEKFDKNYIQAFYKH